MSEIEALDHDTVNMTEMASIIGVSLPTLRKWIRDNKDFPVARRGEKGDPYAFIPEDVKDWLENHDAAALAAKAERTELVRQKRMELFPDGDPNIPEGLTHDEILKELQIREKVRREQEESGALVRAADVDRAARIVFGELRKSFQHVGQDLVRSHAIDRALRLAIDAKIRERMDVALDKMGEHLALAEEDVHAA